MSVSPLGGQERLRAAAAAAALRANSAGRGPNAPGTPRQPDAVSLSATGRSLAAARKAVTDAPDVREDRISAIKAAIADGTYSVDSRTLATKLLKNSG
jgi:negative regulator of flagellin synthesis FlgM